MLKGACTYCGLLMLNGTMDTMSEFPPACSKLHKTCHLAYIQQTMPLQVCQDGRLLYEMLQGRCTISWVSNIRGHAWVSKKLLLEAGHVTCINPMHYKPLVEGQGQVLYIPS